MGKYFIPDQKYLNIKTDPLTIGRIFTPINLIESFMTSPDPKIINQGNLVSKKLNEEFIQAIFDESDKDVHFIPSCECGKLKGSAFEGMHCLACDSIVSTSFTDNLSHKIWLDIPESMPMILHPVAYIILKDWSGGGSRSSAVIDTILNPELDLPEELEGVVPEQGFSYFYENYPKILDYLFHNYPKTSKSKYTPWIINFCTIFRDRLFTNKLPILHNSLHPLVAGSNTLKYADKSSKKILNAIYDLSALTFRISNKKITPYRRKKIDVTLFEVYQNIIEYHKIIIDDKISKKEALIRKHNLGTRCHFSSRAVVVPITGSHHSDEIYLPWETIVNTYKLEIINLLINRYNYTGVQAHKIHLNALVNHSPLIEEIINILIAECKYKGLPFLIGRNPTLNLFSIYLLFVTKVNKNKVISISPNILKEPNIDFDGDELYGQCIKEMDMVEDYGSLHPREAVLSTGSPTVSDSIMPSDQSLINIQAYVHQNPELENGYILISMK